MVRLHAALVALVVAFAISFVADPCGGVGDLCLGGVVGLALIAVAGIGVGGIITWALGRRASPLLVWDALLATFSGATLVSVGGNAVPLLELGVFSVACLSVPGAILTARRVVPHRIERIVGIVALAAFVLAGVAGILVALVGLIALAIGWVSLRANPAVAAAAGDVPTNEGAQENGAPS